MSKHQDEVATRILNNSRDIQLRDAAENFMMASIPAKYSYNFSWQGRPIIQYPQDMVALQELIWAVRPDLIIETGIAHGGSLIFSASQLAMLDMVDAIALGQTLNPMSSNRKVIGVDIDIRPHNYAEITAHPMASRIQMIQGSSIAPNVIKEIESISKEYSSIMVLLDSNHTYEHVLGELEAYGPLTSIGGYCVVFDTVIDDLPEAMFTDRPWGPGNNPKTAVNEYIRNHPEFEIDNSVQDKILISVAPSGYLKRIA